MEELKRYLEDEGLTVSFNPMKGRCLFANKDFRPGEVILREEPYVCVHERFPSFVPEYQWEQKKDPVCQGCFKSSNLKKCSACEVMWYCGSACQKFDWKMHRHECRAISRFEKNWRNLVTPIIFLIVRLYLRRKLQIDKIIPTTAIDNYKLLEALVAHMSSISFKKFYRYARLAEIVKQMFQWPDINVEESIENFSKLSCNAHTITGNEMEPLGIGLYYVISIINHSCLPNSVLVFEGRQAVIRAVQHVQKGDEVLISYIDTGSGTRARQKILLEKYFFTCTCPRCLSHDDAHHEAWKCKKAKCSGFLIHKRGEDEDLCNKCGMVWTPNYRKRVEHKMTSVAKKASTASDIHKFISFSEKTEDFVKEFGCPPSKLLLIRDVLLQNYIKVGDMQKALEYCRLTIPGYEERYKGLHPKLGVRYYNLAKVEWVNGNNENAVDFLNKAVDILKFTHGKETPFMKDLLLKLENACVGALSF